MTTDGVTIRAARRHDVPAVLGLIRDLAGYEREPDAVLTSEADLLAALFAPEPRVHCLVAEVTPAGVSAIAVWFVTYSTWTGQHGIWLEDLYVSPSQRGRGLGRALLSSLAAECVDRGWSRLEWNVLDWNTPALEFYRRLGAVPLDDWTVHRVSDRALAELATGRKV